MPRLITHVMRTTVAPRGGGARRFGLFAIVALLTSLVAAGCQTAAPTEPSLAQCMQAWNHGTVSGSPTNGPLYGTPATGLGLIGRRVWVAPFAGGGSESYPATVGCYVTIDHGQGRFLLFRPDPSVSPDTKASAKQIASHGLTFTFDLNNGFGIQHVYSSAQLAWMSKASAPLPFPGGAPNACQDDDGTLHPAGSCPPPPASPPAGPIDATIAADAADSMRDTIKWQPTWWLGPTLDGFPVTGSEGHSIDIPGDKGVRVWYELTADGGTWQIGVITLKRANPTVPRCPYWHAINDAAICYDKKQVGQLLTTEQSGGNFVAVFATSWNLDGSVKPVPTSIVDTIRASLRQATAQDVESMQQPN